MMKDWPPQHKQLAVVMAVVAVACLGVYFFVVAPRKRENAALREEAATLRKRLRKAGWPLRADRLEAALADMKKRLEGPPGRKLDNPDAEGVKARAERVLAHAGAMFAPRIRRQFGTTEDFILNVSRLDFQMEFNRLQQKLSAAGIHLSPKLLGLAEDSSSPYTYQLMLQVWTLDLLADLLRDSGLAVCTNPAVTVRGESGKHPAARITMLPPVAYTVRRDDERPYLLEFPVRLQLTGTVEAAMKFIRSLTAGGNFLPVGHMQIFTEPPPRPDLRKGGTIQVDTIRIDLECSAFFPLGNGSENLPTNKDDTAHPPGA
jgi:hypothetical protein